MSGVEEEMNLLILLVDNLYRLDTPFSGLPLSLYAIKGDQPVLIDSSISTTPEEFIGHKYYLWVS